MDIVILISADAEWTAVRQVFSQAELNHSPYGEWFSVSIEQYDGILQFKSISRASNPSILFFQGGWGKIAAAGSTQYAIDRWNPWLLINLGTCGGIEGRITRGEILLIDKTIVYDVIEQMGDYDDHIVHYTTEIDVSWIKKPLIPPVKITTLLSADRDILPDQIKELVDKYHATSADWESGAIAWVAARNHKPVLIIRTVTDLVSETGGEAYGNISLFNQSSLSAMKNLISLLPGWLEQINF